MIILAISGSLRAHSSNATLLHAFAVAAAPDAEVIIFDEIPAIPAFNPDLEMTVDSPALRRFRNALRTADAVVFSTPEYAHGIPGALKNALDWIVGSGELSRKPVTLLNASSRGVYAQAALREVLETMDARFIAAAAVSVELAGKSLPAVDVASHYAAALAHSLAQLRLHLAGPAR